MLGPVLSLANQLSLKHSCDMSENSSSTPPGPPASVPLLSLAGIPQDDRPQERLERNGAAALSDKELLAMLLRSGTRGTNVLELSQRIMGDCGNLSGLLNLSREDFQSYPGIGHVKALQLVTVTEIARRILAQGQSEQPIVDDPLTTYNLVRPQALGISVEKFWLISLNRRNRLIRLSEITSGTATASLAHPREVFRQAIRDAATAVIVAHNHPSGDPAPSAPDIRLTRQLNEAAAVIQIELLDHVVIGDPNRDPNRLGYYSFRENGLL